MIVDAKEATFCQKLVRFFTEFLQLQTRNAQKDMLFRY